MNPLKQGLKLRKTIHAAQNSAVFIHESIKTRVETRSRQTRQGGILMSLSMNPLKQGLKRRIHQAIFRQLSVFIHESIKTRVETCRERGRSHD